jgi:hypothetical protein
MSFEWEHVGKYKHRNGQDHENLGILCQFIAPFFEVSDENDN